MKRLLPLLFAALAISVSAQTNERVRTPWHLTDLYWTPANVVTCEQFSVDVTIEGDIDPKVPFYIAPFGGGEGCTINGVQCYGGLQTQPDGGDRGGKNHAKLGTPGVIFSRWGERSFDAIRIAKDGACQSSGHEGDFIGVRVRHTWGPGTYTFTLRGLDREIRDGATNRWVGVFLYEHKTDRETYVGALRFPGDGLVIGKTLTSFVEIYGAPVTLDRVPRATLTFGNHKADGRPVPMSKVIAYHEPKQPHNSKAEAANSNTCVRVTVSPDPAEGKRHYRIW